MSEVKKYTVSEPWLHTQCLLGEASFWDQESNTLRFVDIERKEIHTVDLDQGVSSHKVTQLSIAVTTTANIKGNKDEFVFGGKAGYGIMNKRTHEWRYIKKFWSEQEINDGKEKNQRSNDGSVDKQGRYLVGTMNDPTVTSVGKNGALFRLNPDLSLERLMDPVTIPNGMSWSLDDKTFYFTDSSTGMIEELACDSSNGSIDLSSRKPFWRAPEGTDPDGHARDAEGCFWVALFQGSKVVRVNEQGQVLAEVELPTRSPTCPAICGQDLYITTAKEEEPDKYPESAKYAGAVFKVHIGVKGASLNEFSLDA